MKEHAQRPSGAPQAMHKLGEATDSAIMEVISKNPGVTVSAIAEIVGWSNGRVDGSVNRLLQKGKVTVKHQLQRGVLLKRIYSTDYSMKPHNIIEIPQEMLDKASWENQAYVYALSRSTIGISSRENNEWNAKALLKEHVRVRKSKNTIDIVVSDRVADFYQLQNSETSLSIIGNVALVTVETVLPIKPSPSDHEEPNNCVVDSSAIKILPKSKSKR